MSLFVGIRFHEDSDLFQRLASLRKQIEPQLRPVLREQDFVEFDLERAFKTVVEMAKKVA